MIAIALLGGDMMPKMMEQMGSEGPGKTMPNMKQEQIARYSFGEMDTERRESLLARCRVMLNEMDQGPPVLADGE